GEGGLILDVAAVIAENIPVQPEWVVDGCLTLEAVKRRRHLAQLRCWSFHSGRPQTHTEGGTSAARERYRIIQTDRYGLLARGAKLVVARAIFLLGRETAVPGECTRHFRTGRVDLDVVEPNSLSRR